jgi:hypothetical protein
LFIKFWYYFIEYLKNYYFKFDLNFLIHKKIPGGYVFIIADSLTNDPTLMTSGKRKDLRNCEIRIAIRLLLNGLAMNEEMNK